MKITIPRPEIKKIIFHAEETFPEECVGVIIGNAKNDAQVVDTRKMKNINTGSKNTRYNIDPLELLKLEDELDESGLILMGIYHSHPNHPARPSKYDLDHAWPNLSYIVLSIKEGKFDELTSWRLDRKNEKFRKEELIIAENTN